MSEINLDEGKLRYGTSALDLKYKDHACDDELMVDGKNGEMFYKRPDGQIVSSPNQKYNKIDLINAINDALITSDDVNIVDGDYVVYNTISIAGMTNLLNSDVQSLDLESTFSSNKADSGIFIRVRGNYPTNAIVSFLQSLYNSEHSETLPAVSVSLSVTELGTGTKRNITINTAFDKLSFSKLYSTEPSDGCTGYEIKVESVSFPMLAAAYNELSSSSKSLLSELNFGNVKFEADAIDVIYYTSDLDNTTISNNADGVTLNYVVDAKETQNSPFVVSKAQPSHECIWAKILD